MKSGSRETSELGCGDDVTVVMALYRQIKEEADVIVDRYYYAQLNKQEQAVYKAFYNGLMAHEDVIPIPIRGQLSKEVFNKIFRQ